MPSGGSVIVYDNNDGGIKLIKKCIELVERYDNKHLKKVEARISIDRKKMVIVCRVPEVTDKFRFSKYIGEKTYKVLPSIEYIKKEHEKNIKKRNYKIIKAEHRRCGADSDRCRPSSRR